jgi:hypothetical protein
MKYSDCIHKSVCKHVIVDEVCVGGCKEKYYESTKLLEDAVAIAEFASTICNSEMIQKAIESFLIRAKERLQG